MDAMRGLDPSSSKFHTQAAKNISQVGFGALKTTKDLKEKDDDSPLSRDDVKLSGNATVHVDHAELMEGAAHSGELAEYADDLREDEDEQDVRERRDREGKVFGGRGDDRVNSTLAGEQQVRRLEDLDNASFQVNEVLQDIPQANLQAAQNIMAGQIRQGEPVQSLTQLKPVEGTGDFEMQRAEAVGILDIHDTLAAAPAPMDFAAEIPLEQQAAMADAMLEGSIERLPEDRRAVVDELRTAVTAWAGENGTDAGQQFAEKLHDLAKGWDDDALQVAARTWVEVAAAAAA